MVYLTETYPFPDPSIQNTAISASFMPPLGENPRPAQPLLAAWYWNVIVSLSYFQYRRNNPAESKMILTGKSAFEAWLEAAGAAPAAGAMVEPELEPEPLGFDPGVLADGEDVADGIMTGDCTEPNFVWKVMLLASTASLGL